MKHAVLAEGLDGKFKAKPLVIANGAGFKIDRQRIGNVC